MPCARNVEATVLEICDETEVATMWFVDWEGADWLGCVFRPPGEPWRAVYRFRYHDADEDRVFDSKDEKSWYRFDLPEDRSVDDLVDMLATVADATRMRCGGHHDRIVVNGMGPALLDERRKRPWFHMKPQPRGADNEAN